MAAGKPTQISIPVSPRSPQQGSLKPSTIRAKRTNYSYASAEWMAVVALRCWPQRRQRRTRIGTGRSEVGRHLNRGIISFRISHHPYTILCKTRQSDILYLTGDELPEGDAYPAARLEIFFSFHSGCSNWERWAQRNLIVVVGKRPRGRGSRFHSTYSG